jgi:creatinine amidohydrolase
MLRRWAELKTGDFGRRRDQRIALLPVSAIEQHGPHLPLGTDSFILDAIIDGLEGKLAKGTDIIVLPHQAIANSLEHSDFPGTLAQDPETLIAQWTEIGEAVFDAGISKLAIVNGHGGQPQIVDLVAQRLRAENRMLVARVNTFRFGMPDGLFPADELAFGYHGGEIETSLMLAIAPKLVDMTKAKRFTSLAAKLAKENRVLQAEGPAGFAWQAQDLNPAGVTGNAAKADPARGRKLLTHLSTQLAAALDDMTRFPVSRLKAGLL